MFNSELYELIVRSVEKELRVTVEKPVNPFSLASGLDGGRSIHSR